VSDKKPKELAIRYTPAMLQSAALRVLPPLGHKVLHAFECRLVCGGPDGKPSVNGELRVPQSLVLEWMCSGDNGSLPLAIKQCMDLGFIRRDGRNWRLTYFPVWEKAPTNEWSGIRTIEEAEAIIGKKKRRPQTGKYRSNLNDMTWPKRKQRIGLGHNEGPALAFSISSTIEKIAETNED
jgi:hypothetical protein